METKDIRRANLHALIQDFTVSGKNKKSQLADKIGIPAAQLSQISGNNPIRNIGDKIARRIEKSLNLPIGWMDVIHTKTLNPSKKDDPFILQNSSKTYTDHIYRINHYDIEYSCGGGRVYSEYPDIIKAVEINPEHALKMFGERPSTSLAIITAVGDSMLGTIDPGSLVVIDKTIKQYIGDGIYAFTFGENMHIKRLQLSGDKLLVINDNNLYEKWEINCNNEERLSINGFVIGKWNINYSRLG
ncbi:MAG TPA: S24 family peptidase [Arsenophonus nasoniae]|uniref:S24 family peptidase n=1 Tax=Arsenophonus nasoniae TaxID=638 RepID=UPI00387990BD